MIVCISFWFVANFCCKSVNEMQYSFPIFVLFVCLKKNSRFSWYNNARNLNLPSLYRVLNDILKNRISTATFLKHNIFVFSLRNACLSLPWSKKCVNVQLFSFSALSFELIMKRYYPPLLIVILTFFLLTLLTFPIH